MPVSTTVGRDVSNVGGVVGGVIGAAAGIIIITILVVVVTVYLVKRKGNVYFYSIIALSHIASHLPAPGKKSIENTNELKYVITN